MEIILSKQCAALTGSFIKGYGYHIQRRKNGFFAKRNSNGEIPANGHLRFIVACADLAKMKTHIADIRVSREELAQALAEAGYSPRRQCLPPSRAIVPPASRCPVLASSASEFPASEPLSASDIINFRRDYLPNQA